MEQRSNPRLHGNARPRPQSLRAAGIALTGLAAVFLIEMLDTSVLNVALPTIAKDLAASASELQWVSGAYALMFGALMLVFGSIADRFGRRRMMLIGLALFGMSSAAVLFVSTPEELVLLRALIGIAAAMTAPGSMALTFRLFEDDALRVRATALISTVGLVGLAVGPTIGGLVLAIAPWQALLLINVPIAALAFLGIRLGIRADRPDELRLVPIDVLGAVLGTAAIVLALLTPTMLLDAIPGAWAVGVAAMVTLAAFVVSQRRASHPLIDVALLRRRPVSTGLIYQAALGLATAGLGYTVTLQLQLVWGWPPALAALGVLPQVITMIAIGPFVERIVKRFGIDKPALFGACAVITGLLLYALLGRFSYALIAIAIMLVAAGMRVTMITATINVMRGLPSDRTSIGAALNDTAQELAAGIGIAIVGLVIAASISGPLTAAGWTSTQSITLENAITIGVLSLTTTAFALLAGALVRTRRSRAESAPR